jgi:hypothetical protein
LPVLRSFEDFERFYGLFVFLLFIVRLLWSWFLVVSLCFSDRLRPRFLGKVYF